MTASGRPVGLFIRGNLYHKKNWLRTMENNLFHRDIGYRPAYAHIPAERPGSAQEVTPESVQHDIIEKGNHRDWNSRRHEITYEFSISCVKEEIQQMQAT